MAPAAGLKRMRSAGIGRYEVHTLAARMEDRKIRA